MSLLTPLEKEAMWQLHKELNGYPIPLEAIRKRAAALRPRLPPIPRPRIPIPVPRPQA